MKAFEFTEGPTVDLSQLSNERDGPEVFLPTASRPDPTNCDSSQPEDETPAAVMQSSKLARKFIETGWKPELPVILIPGLSKSSIMFNFSDFRIRISFLNCEPCRFLISKVLLLVPLKLSSLH